MKRTKVLAAFGLFAIAAIMGIVSLSSFSGKAEAKVPEVKVFTPVELYFDNGVWVEDNPGADCGFNGAICSGAFERDASITRSDAQILNDAASKYAALGHLTNPAINSDVVQVGKTSVSDPNTVAVTITERANQ